MCDKLVFDLSQEVEGSPNVFVRKDWINILDNQNQNYSNNQSIIDTSQLSNSNKYMSYREAYLSIPLLLTLATPTNGMSIVGAGATIGAHATLPAAETATSSQDYSIGLKNWFGSVIHSLTLDYNGTTIVQQTPYANMWNNFKLLTSFSWQDVYSQGATIGFYPDDPTTFTLYPAGVGSATTSAGVAGSDYIGNGVCNNTNSVTSNAVYGSFTQYQAGLGNMGFVSRQQYINYDPDASLGTVGQTVFANGISSGTHGSLLLSASNANLLWKSYIFKKKTMVVTDNTATITTPSVLQIAVVATIYLKHIHSFFNMAPLLKGVFMKLTLNLNNASSTIITCASNGAAGVTAFSTFLTSGTSVPIGGVNPLMISSPQAFLGTSTATRVGLNSNGGVGLTTMTTPTVTAAGTIRTTFIANLSVGARCLENAIVGANVLESPLSKSVYLYVPAYTFNPVFEQAFLSTPVKQIKYTDIYQYQILNVPTGNTFNNLITNGIANIKSVLLIPFFSSTASGTVENLKTNISLSTNTFLPAGMPVWQSPFDPAGCGCTSPMAHITNFNVQVSGQNAIYNLQKYGFEAFNNQLYGQNSVNGGLTDGLTSGLIDRLAFDLEYCYYYVNVERMLPVEQSVPKSVQVIGQNTSGRAMDYWVFVEYGNEISIDALTGARV